MGIIYRPAGRAAEYSYLAANLYIGCSHRCMYCYVPDVMHNNKFFTEQTVRKDVLYQLQREAPNFAGTDERVLLCFACDPYQPLDDTEQITRKAIEILRDNDVPFQILTKGGMRAARDFDLYGTCDAFGTTLTFLDPQKSKLHEPNAALPAERIEAIEKAKSEGIETWVSLEPIIDARQTLEIIRQTHQIVDHYKIGILNHHTSNINWRKFGMHAINLCRHFETDYYIKKDLAKYLSGFPYCGADRRKAKRQ